MFRNYLLYIQNCSLSEVLTQINYFNLQEFRHEFNSASFNILIKIIRHILDSSNIFNKYSINFEII